MLSGLRLSGRASATDLPLCEQTASVLYPGYLYAYMTSARFQSRLSAELPERRSTGLRQTDVLRLKIPLPPLASKKPSRRSLGALDDKIELNRRMNATLEAMARALFQSWFVDFDPVRAKLDGRQPPGLDPATAALFPNEFEDSELGHIPKGWDISLSVR